MIILSGFAICAVMTFSIHGFPVCVTIYGDGSGIGVITSWFVQFQMFAYIAPDEIMFRCVVFFWGHLDSMICI